MSDKSLETVDSDEVRILKARISTLETENESLRDDISELEKEMEYISRSKHTKRKRNDDE
jgi:predicted  nucleic acid-binding Zn-ribbon protein